MLHRRFLDSVLKVKYLLVSPLSCGTTTTAECSASYEHTQSTPPQPTNKHFKIKQKLIDICTVFDTANGHKDSDVDLEDYDK